MASSADSVPSKVHGKGTMKTGAVLDLVLRPTSASEGDVTTVDVDDTCTETSGPKCKRQRPKTWFRKGSDSLGFCLRCCLRHPRRSDVQAAHEVNTGSDAKNDSAADAGAGSSQDRRDAVPHWLVRRIERAELQQQRSPQPKAKTAEQLPISWHRVRGLVAYGGIGLHGFQRQHIDGWVMPTVQTMLEESLARAFNLFAPDLSLLGLKCKSQSDSFATIGPNWGQAPPLVVSGASRTDGGVGAERQVFHFDLVQRPDDDALLEKLQIVNADLERVKQALGLTYKIQVVALENVTLGRPFCSLKDAIGKRYCYTIFDGAGDPPVMPLLTSTSSVSLQFVEYNQPAIRKHRPDKVRRLDDARMHALAHCFVGKAKNFRLFSRTGSKVRGGFHRSINRARVFRTAFALGLDSRRTPTFDDAHDPNGDFVHFLVEAPGFLFLMVRCMVSALLLVGEGKKQPDDITSYCFDPPEDEQAANKVQFCPAHANGLVLASVFYDNDEGKQGQQDLIFGGALRPLDGSLSLKIKSS